MRLKCDAVRLLFLNEVRSDIAPHSAGVCEICGYRLDGVEINKPVLDTRIGLKKASQNRSRIKMEMVATKNGRENVNDMKFGVLNSPKQKKVKSE